MSGDQLDLDGIEHEAARLGGLVDSATVLALVAEVRRLRALEDSLTEERDNHPSWKPARRLVSPWEEVE